MNTSTSTVVAPTLRCVEKSTSTISVVFTPNDINSRYILQWMLQSKKWDNNDAVSQTEIRTGATRAQVNALKPNTMYCLRLIHQDGTGRPGPTLMVDTKNDECCCCCFEIFEGCEVNM